MSIRVCCPQCGREMEQMSDPLTDPSPNSAETDYGCPHCNLVFTHSFCSVGGSGASLKQYPLTYRAYKARQEGRLEEFLDKEDALSGSPFL